MQATLRPETPQRLFLNASTATAGLIHCPCPVALDQAFKRLLRRQAFVNVDRNRHVGQAKRRAAVCRFVRDADRPFNNRRVGVRGIAQAVVMAADA
jgi:hypothetical protein